MNLENQTKESPLEKARRLKAEKELKDQTRTEDEAKKQAEFQAKTEKLNALNSEKQDLEGQLNDINSKLEASRSEAHETRDTMKEGELDKDEEFKDEYSSTISEVAGNLNELRNEKNLIKSKLEKINSDIENFDINESINEGEEILQNQVETLNQENEEAVKQVEVYPGAETTDVNKAQEIINETNNEVKNIEDMSRAEIEALIMEEGKENPLSPDKQFANLVKENYFQKGIEREKDVASKFLNTLNQRPPERNHIRTENFDQYGTTKIYEVNGKEYNEYSPEIQALEIKKLEWKTSLDNEMSNMNRFQWNEASNLINQNSEQAKNYFNSMNEVISERMNNHQKLEILKNIPGKITGDIDKIDFRNFVEVLPVLSKEAVNSFEEAKQEMISSSGDKIQDDWNKSRLLGRFVESLAIFDKLNTPIGGGTKESNIFSAVAEQRGLNEIDLEASEALPGGPEELKNMRNFAKNNILKIASEKPENLIKVFNMDFVELDNDSRGNYNDKYVNSYNKSAANLANIIDSGIFSKKEIKTVLQKIVETIKKDPDKIIDKRTAIGSITALEGTGSLNKNEIQEILNV